ncbi:MAG: NAD-dependent epimerase/dehydratase family protein [Chloroflexota bacterium]
MTVVITGGAGFVGAAISIAIKRRWSERAVIAFDSLHRRGSELNLPRLAEAGVSFMHGDVRCEEDLDLVPGPLSLLIDCAAEPSVTAAYTQSPRAVLTTNLGGTINCLERARRDRCDVVLLSTSRVYSIPALRGLPLVEAHTRLAMSHTEAVPGASDRGISEAFPVGQHCSLYGASKLASELLLAEYAAMYDFRFLVNRCGVIAGPGQFARSDQGVFALWMLRHMQSRPLRYIGWGGTGLQVRDLLHVEDLVDLLLLQTGEMERHNGKTYNVGGGVRGSLSLRETTELCHAITGNALDLASEPTTHPADIPYYVTDFSQLSRATGWTPRRSPEEILRDIHAWITGLSPQELAVLDPGAS